MTTTRYTAELTDPITGEQTHLAANTLAELQQLIDGTLARMYQEPMEA